jgi:Ca2+-binding RTX toxin-like protein
MLTILPFLLLGLGLAAFVGGGDDDDDNIGGSLSNDDMGGSPSNEAPTALRGSDEGDDLFADERTEGDILAFAGDDLVNISGDSEFRVLLGDGDDTANLDAGETTVFGGAGDDSVTAGTGPTFARGGAGSDTLLGGDGDDTLLGDTDGDEIRGGAGDDSIDGGFGADLLVGDDGDDVINGGAGDDFIIGAEGNDEMNGGDGDDTVVAFSGANTLTGGAGDDILDALTLPLFSETGTPSTLDGGEGDDSLFADDGDVLTGGDGTDFFEIYSDGTTETVTITDFNTMTEDVDILLEIPAELNDMGPTFVDVVERTDGSGTDLVLLFPDGSQSTVVFLEGVTGGATIFGEFFINAV